MLNRSRPTVADIRANKGKRQMTMVHIENREEARACAAAGIDVLSIETPIWDAGMREAAGDTFVQVGLQYGRLQTTDDYLRGAHDAMQIGGDCCYCAASTQIVERLSEEGIPIVLCDPRGPVALEFARICVATRRWINRIDTT